MVSFAEDYKFGIAKEEEIKELIEALVETTITLKGGRSTLDIHSETVDGEIKSRRIAHDAYPTTIVGKNKIDAFQRSDKKHYLFFNFTDGLYFIEYDSHRFGGYRIQDDYYRSYRSDFGNPRQTVYHIPVEDLTLLAWE